MFDRDVKTVAFFDAEFTSKSDGQNRGEQELIQYAILIYKVIEKHGHTTLSNDPIFEATSFVKPSMKPVLSKYIKKLTKITQQDVDEGKPLISAVDDIYHALKKYNTRDVYVWGPDRLVLRTNLLLSKSDTDNSRFVCGKFKDLSRKISQKLGYDRPITQHAASEKLHLAEIGSKHNAYYDALNLAQIYRQMFCIKP